MTRIREVRAVDGKFYYVIDEVISPCGYYITWTGVYETLCSAQKAIRQAERRPND